MSLYLRRLTSRRSHYKGAAEDARPLAFVGKGITFDSGGISLKPALVESAVFFDQTCCSIN
jgi:hypothetical protein